MSAHDEITEKIIGCAYTVYNRLGSGFLESVYEKSLVIELRKKGLEVEAQVSIKVWYDEEEVGNFVADLIVQGEIIVELKAIEGLAKKHEVQLVNYLVATKKETGLLINFGPDGVTVKRKFNNTLH